MTIMDDVVDIVNYHTCNYPIEWKGMYEQDSKYKKYRDPSTNVHPAKMPVALAIKIIHHLSELGMIDTDSRIIDFMAGTGTTGIAAELCGHRFVGVELEDIFIEMIKKNGTAMHNNIGREPEWTIIKGDARELSNIISEAIGIVSPPYAHTVLSYARNGIIMDGKKYHRPYMDGVDGYSHSPYNIGNLKDVGIVSPPYGLGKGIGHSGGGDQTIINEKGIHIVYTDNISNIGNKVGESYQSAMLQVYKEAYKANISPLVIVTKNPTKNRRIRRLDLDTISLLRMAGYSIVDYHRAILWEEYMTTGSNGETVKMAKGRMSFFKRLQYRQGIPVARWEDVIFATKAK